MSTSHQLSITQILLSNLLPITTPLLLLLQLTTLPLKGPLTTTPLFRTTTPAAPAPPPTTQWLTTAPQLTTQPPSTWLRAEWLPRVPVGRTSTALPCPSICNSTQLGLLRTLSTTRKALPISPMRKSMALHPMLPNSTHCPSTQECCQSNSTQLAA